MAKCNLNEIVKATEDAETFEERCNRILELLPKNYYLLGSLEATKMTAENLLDLIIYIQNRKVKDLQWSKFVIKKKRYFIAVGKVKL